MNRKAPKAITPKQRARALRNLKRNAELAANVPGRTLRALRMKKGLTLKDVKAATGLPIATIAYIEQGKGQNFSPEYKHVLARYFGKNPLTLFPELIEQAEAILKGPQQIQMFLRKD